MLIVYALSLQNDKCKAQMCKAKLAMCSDPKS